MKIQNLISKVLQKAAPMAPSEHNELENNMAVWFDKQQADAKLKDQKLKEGVENAESLNLKDKAFLLLDAWYMRALFAMSFIFIVRWVQDFMNPGDDHDDQFDEIPQR